MTLRVEDPGDAYELAIMAYGLIGLQVRHQLEASPHLRALTISTVRRLVAARYDWEDCVSPSHAICWRNEVRGLARALREIDDLGRL